MQATHHPLRNYLIHLPTRAKAATIDSLSQRSTMLYDAAGRAIAAVDPQARRTSTVYDALGRGVAAIDANNVRTSTAYDAAGRAIALLNGRGYRTTSGYDAAGRRIQLIDANNHTVTFLFDAVSQNLSSINPLNRRVSFAYDPDGRRTLNLDPRGNRITCVYDALARQTQILYATRRSTFAYDAVVLDADTECRRVRVGEQAVQGIKWTQEALAEGFNWAVGEVVTFGQGLKFTVSSLAGGIVEGLTQIGSLFNYYLTVGAFCLIDAALTTAHIQPDDFWSALDAVGGQLQALASNATQLIGNFLSGAKIGVENFGAKLPKYFTEGLAKWLNIPPEIFEQITMPDPTKVPEVILELLGYTWNDLLALVQAALQPLDLAIVTKLFSEVSKALDLGLVAYVQEKVSELIQQVTNFVDMLKPTLIAALQKMLTTILVQVAEKVATALAVKLLSLLSPVGWLGQLAKGIYDAIRFFIDNFAKIDKLFNRLKAVYTAVIQGISVQEIASRVESALADSVAPALAALASLAKE